MEPQTTPATSTIMSYSCVKPNFTIRTTPIVTEFRVNKKLMAKGSTVFADMFGVCDDVQSEGGKVEEEQSMEIHERPETFGLFLSLLHGGPSFEQDITTSPVPKGAPTGNNAEWDSDSDSDDDLTPSVRVHPAPPAPPNPLDLNGPATEAIPLLPLPEVVPFPLLRPLFDLADKYDISPALVTVLHRHLKESASENAHEVYAFAHQLELTSIASHASAFLISRALDTYTHEEVAMYFPSVKAYHRITLLHAFRKKELRRVLVEEQLFPHNYGWCSQHGKAAVNMWDLHRKNVNLSISSATDLSTEMSVIKGSMPMDCAMCRAAVERSLDMLGYKAMKVPRRFDRVPGAM